MKKLILLIAVLFITTLAIADGEDVASSRSIKEYFKQHTDLRIGADSVEEYKLTLNEMTVKVIEKAKAIVEKDKRKTLLKRDIQKASDEVFRRAPMNVTELMEKIKQLSIIELADLSKQIKAYGEDLLEARKE